jgi:acyl-CoA-binding protein
MADSIDRVFAHALSTVRKIPRTGSLRPPSADRLRLYGLYKQSMEGDVVHVMPRPLPASLVGPNEEAYQSTSTYPLESSFTPEQVEEALAIATAEDKAEMEKWDAWKACEGLSRTDAKRHYIATLMDTMRVYASGTRESRALVEELEFVWEQVKGNASRTGSGTSGRSVGSGNRPKGDSSEDEMERTDRGLRVLRPMSDVDEGELAAEEEDIEQEAESSRGVGEQVENPPRRNSPTQWRRRVERALVQMTAEVAALRELVDATSSQRRLWARSGKKGWVLWACRAVWKLIKRAIADAMVVAVLIMVLRWRYKERVEDWWDNLGEWLGFVKKNLREGIKKSDVRGLLGR